MKPRDLGRWVAGEGCTALNMIIMDRGLPKDIVEDKVTDHKLVDTNFTFTNTVVVTAAAAAAGIH
jgi:hypothetical protein